jgi:membrane fusion protein, heavy metal efflux system
MLRKYFISKTIVTLLIIALSSCSGGKIKDDEKKESEIIPEDIVEMREDQVRLAEIELGPIEMRSLSGILKTNGLVVVAPRNFATVCAPMGGFIISTDLMPGMSVTKGQTLAMIENQDFVDIQQNYLESRSRFEYAEAEYRRHTELYKDDVYSQKNLEEVTAEYKTLKAQVNALEQKLALIGIKPSEMKEDDISRSVALVSPINGYIKTVNVNLGKFVSQSEVLFEIVNSDKLFLELNFFEKDADKVQSGQHARFFINNESEQHDAVITQTGKAIGADKTFKVYASVTGICKNVLPGMYVNAIVETSGNEVATLPSEAVVSFDDKDYIFIYEKDKVENGNPFTEYRMVEVQKGISDGGFTELILPAGFDIATARVVIKGAYNLLSARKNAGEMAC